MSYVHGFQPRDKLKLLINRQTHNTILEYGLGLRLAEGRYRTTQELVDYHKASLKRQSLEIQKARLRTRTVEEVINDEAEYFTKILSGNGIENLLNASPVAIEKRISCEIGGVPVVFQLDLIAKVKDADEIWDLKRLGRKPQLGLASESTQLTTEAIGTGVNKVSLVSIVETLKPYVVSDPGLITEGQKERVAAIYFDAAKAISSGVFPPVDKSDPRRKWKCSYMHCPYWDKEARDQVTGANISCKFGERSIS